MPGVDGATQATAEPVKAAASADSLTARRAISPREFAQQMGISEASALRACRDKRIRCVRLGKRYLIPVDESARVLREGLDAD